MKNCKFSDEIIRIAYKNDISANDGLFLEKHFAECADCKLLFAFHQKIKKQNLNILKPVPSNELKSRIFNSLSNEKKNNAFIDTAYAVFHKHFITAACAVIIFFIISGIINFHNFIVIGVNTVQLPNITDTADLTEHQQKIVSSEITGDLLLQIAFDME